jgi:hypothetical protein
MKQKIYVGYKVKNGEAFCIGFNFNKFNMTKIIEEDKYKDPSFEYVLHNKVYEDGIIKVLSFERF